jgi:hypothetical protein
VPYTTFSGTVENKVYWSKSKFDRYFTGGLLLNYDKQGSLSLTSMQVGLPVSVTLPVTKFGFLTVGATPAFGQRSFGTEKLISMLSGITAYTTRRPLRTKTSSFKARA